jgi:hypothetical protein
VFTETHFVVLRKRTICNFVIFNDELSTLYSDDRLSAVKKRYCSAAVLLLLCSANALLELWCRMLSPTGSFRAYTFWTLSETHSRLYQRRFLRPRLHFSAFFKLYIFSFAPFRISAIFQAFAPFSPNFGGF